MNQHSVSQQLYVNQGQFIISNQSGKSTHKQPTYCIWSIMSLLIGILICGVPLASVLTLYIKQQSCTSESTTTVLTITTTIATTSQTTTQMNQTNSSVSTEQAYYCTGISSFTLWQLFSTDGITMNIDTSSCNFNSTPLYFTSITGSSSHWDLGGYAAIYSPTKNSFTIYARALVAWSNTVMLGLSQTYQWDVDWFGILN